MCEISNSLVQRFQSWYFPDKPYYLPNSVIVICKIINQMHTYSHYTCVSDFSPALCLLLNLIYVKSSKAMASLHRLAKKFACRLCDKCYILMS